MELCELGSITDIAQKYAPKYIPEPIVAHVLASTVKALQFMHTKRIIHRDIKGQNILFNARGEVKLVDFGIDSPSSRIVL